MFTSINLSASRIAALAATSLLFVGSAAAQSFVSPIGGIAYKDWTIVNYVDRTAGSGISDYNGGTYTYNGHDAIDYTLANFAAMDRGVGVFAAGAGTVASVHDGEFDRCSRVNSCPDNANYIIIDHGNGIESRYWHLKNGSTTVAVGDAVSAGQQIGLVGSSGLSSDAHLHFAVYENGQAVDPYADPSRWWVDPLPYAGQCH